MVERLHNEQVVRDMLLESVLMNRYDRIAYLIGGKYYGFDYNGAMYADTTFQIAMEHYHAKKSGELYTSQWVKENAGWYYYGSDAKAYRNGSYTIGGKSYSFNAIGVCTNP